MWVAHPLFDSAVDDRRLHVVASLRGDGDLHPRRSLPSELRVRQRAVAPPDRPWSMTDQVHGVGVLDVDEDGSEPWRPILGVADVIVTRRSDVPIAIWAADCAPIVLAADDGTLVAAHGGWRGLGAGVVDVAVATATLDGGSIVSAVLGPVIHPCCYAFDAADRSTIPDAVEGRTAGGRSALDVPATVTALLARHDVGLDAVGDCTGCDDRWFSHRVRSDLGRHAIVAWWEAVA